MKRRDVWDIRHKKALTILIGYDKIEQEMRDSGMTEKEKAAQGLLYNANYDPQLQQERLESICVCHAYNQLHPKDMAKREAMMRKHLKQCKEHFVIEQPFICDYGYRISIGDYFFSNYNLVILDCAEVTFGDHVFIAPNCGFYTAGHPLDVEDRNVGLEYAYPIKVGNNVWIGAGVHVLAGVTIGDNCVIGAGSVVNKDIPANTLAAGNPCKVIRNIQPDDKLRYPR